MRSQRPCLHFVYLSGISQFVFYEQSINAPHDIYPKSPPHLLQPHPQKTPRNQTLPPFPRVVQIQQRAHLTLFPKQVNHKSKVVWQITYGSRLLLSTLVFAFGLGRGRLPIFPLSAARRFSKGLDRCQMCTSFPFQLRLERGRIDAPLHHFTQSGTTRVVVLLPSARPLIL